MAQQRSLVARAAGTAPKKKIAAPRVSKKDPDAPAREEWAALRPDMDQDKALAYNMDGRYRTRSLVDHPVFGLGMVKRKAGPRKIEVLFAEGCKLLRCQ